MTSSTSTHPSPRLPDTIHGSSSTSRPATNFGSRLRQVIGDEAIYSFSRRSNVSDTALRSYLKGSVPGIDKVQLIAEAAGVNVEWLITGKGPIHPDDLDAHDDDPGSASDYVYIPLVDLEVSAGPGRVAEAESIVDVVAFEAQWLRSQLNTNPAKLSLVTVKGDSMSPTLLDGDLIFVDHTEMELRDGIYVFQIDGDLLVKRLQRLPGAQLSVISDNPHFPPFTIDLRDPGHEFNLIGRYRGRLSFA